MDSLEYACSEILRIAEKRPPEDASYQDLQTYAYRKSFDVQTAVMAMGKILRARLAQKVSFDHLETNGNAGIV